MANYGIGIGAFMANLQEANRAGDAAQARGDARSDQKAQQAFSNDLATKADTRAGASSALALQQGQTNLDQSRSIFANQQADRAQQAPLIAAQTADKLSDITDANDTSAINSQASADADAAYGAAKAKSISTGQDKNGNPTFAVDGVPVASQMAADTLFDQTHANKMQTYYNTTGPRIINNMLASGDIAGANAFQKAHQDENFSKGVQTIGRLETHFQAGNMDGVARELKNVIANDGYTNSPDYDASVNQVTTDDGKPAIRISYTNKKTGESQTHDFANLSDLHQFASGYISPQSRAAAWDAANTAAAAANAKSAEGLEKLKNDITLANVNSANTKGENAAKVALPETADQRARQIQAMINGTNAGGGFPQVPGPDGKLRDMTQQEIYDQTARTYDANRLAAGVPPSAIYGAAAPAGAQQAAPILRSRPDTPPPRSIMPVLPPPAAAPVAPGPGSVQDYENKFHLENVPDVPRAPPLPNPKQPSAAYPAQGEGVGAYERRLGLTDAPAPPLFDGATSQTPQGEGISAYESRFGLNAPQQGSASASKGVLSVYDTARRNSEALAAKQAADALARKQAQSAR